MLTLAVVSWAQQAVPVPAITKAPGDSNDVAVSAIILARGGENFSNSPSDWHAGTGAEATITHYFTRHLGFTAETDLLKSNFVLFREYGFRGGPTFRLFLSPRFQPFGRALFGYSRYKETNTGPTRPYEQGFSYIVGGGSDIRIVGQIFARVSGDFEANPAFADVKTHAIRVGIGLKYAFGNR